ncbi:MAG TPA: hypothetical protein VM580_04015, partial [Labilithrix sp.]|nr:hypothetical protein [Labilithrix sp.]
KATCDMTLGNAGDACVTAGTKRDACSLDGNKLLRCSDDKFVIVADCTGADKCQVKDDKGICDQTTSTVDAPCLSEEATACSADGTKGLKCTGGKFTAHIDCAGPNKCRIEDEKLKCDQTIAAPDTTCIADGSYACTADGTKLLKCSSGKFAVDEDCAAQSATCKLANGAAGCG